MKINAKKVKELMVEQKLNLESMGKKFRPHKSRQSVCYLIRHAKTFDSITAIARVLGVDPKDLLK